MSQDFNEADYIHRQDVAQALGDYEASMQNIGGCGNHGCLVHSPQGMGTNAGCRCWSEKFTAQRAMIAARRLQKRLRELAPTV